MEEASSAEKELQTSFEAVHFEIVVPQAELQSKEGVNRIIKKYQNRISEMLKLIQKQKRQNESLKVQFKQLNEQLSSVLKKVQQKPKEEEHKPSESRSQITKKQLENQIKKNGILRKQLDQLRYKFQYLNGQQIDSFKNQIKEKQRIIEELNAQIRLFEKLDKQEKNGDSYKKEEELNHKIMQQNEQIVHLKKKVQEHKKKQQEMQKTIKTCREQVSTLEIKLTAKTAPPEPKKKNKHADPELHQQFQKLLERYKQLQNAKKLNDKNSRLEIDNLNLKLKHSERQLAQSQDIIARKQKESSIILYRLKEKERKNFNTLEPIKTARYSQDVIHNNSGGLFETHKVYRGLNWGQGIYRQFDDSSKLPTEKNYRIKRMVFTYSDDHILSLTTDYDILEGQPGKSTNKENKTIESFSIPSQYNNIKIVELLLGDYEYIANMDLFCGKGIEYIRIATSKERILEVGNPRCLPKTKQHSFDIGTHEKPIALMGVIQGRKNGSQTQEFLVNVGLELKRKEVFIGGSGRRAGSSLHRSILQRSRNDKNRLP